MIRHAFKEWAVICRALAEGRQAIILRKGGIAEENGIFRPEHSRFWLYPTYVHQQCEGIKAGESTLLADAERDCPPSGQIRLSHYVDVNHAFVVDRLDTALALDRLHIWSLETVQKRFAYREPGLYVLAVRVYRASAPIDVHVKPAYDGCKTWVELDRGLNDEGTAVLDENTYAKVVKDLEGILNPRTFA